MRIHLLLLSLTFSLNSMAQFHTIAPSGSYLNTKQKVLIEQSSSINPNSVDTIKERVNNNLVKGGEHYHLSVHPPLKGDLHISSRFGRRNNPFGKKTTEHHSGLDLRAKAGTPIYAMLPGTVEAIGYDSRSGNYIKLRHGNFTVSYCHLIKKPTIPLGTHVAAGTPVAFVGSTGRSTGPHLHITLKHHGTLINPAIFIKLAEEYEN